MFRVGPGAVSVEIVLKIFEASQNSSNQWQVHCSSYNVSQFLRSMNAVN